MNEPSFDPSGFYQFDFELGVVRTKGGSRVVMVTEHILSSLVSAAVLQGDLTAVRRLGKQLGEQIANTLESLPQAAPEIVLGHATAILGIFGWGKIGFERWGDAVVVFVENAPLLDDKQLALGSLMGGIFTSLAGREVSCVRVAAGKFLIVDPGIADQIVKWVEEGSTIGQVAERLEQGVSL